MYGHLDVSSSARSYISYFLGHLDVLICEVDGIGSSYFVGVSQSFLVFFFDS